MIVVAVISVAYKLYGDIDPYEDMSTQTLKKQGTFFVVIDHRFYFMTAILIIAFLLLPV